MQQAGRRLIPAIALMLSLAAAGARAELERDFLWRTTRSLPERGRIGSLRRRSVR